MPVDPPGWLPTLLDSYPPLGAVSRSLLEQVQRLRDTPVDEDELERVKAQIRAEKVYEQDSIFYQAMQIGVLETVGLDWRLLDEYADRIGAVTAEQVRDDLTALPEISQIDLIDEPV